MSNAVKQSSLKPKNSEKYEHSEKLQRPNKVSQPSQLTKSTDKTAYKTKRALPAKKTKQLKKNKLTKTPSPQQLQLFPNLGSDFNIHTKSGGEGSGNSGSSSNKGGGNGTGNRSGKKQKRFFGGALLLGRRKGKRPLNANEALHLVLKSQFGRGGYSFRKPWNQVGIERILKKASRKYKVKIYRQAIQSNHIHLVIKIPSRKAYVCFISVVSGAIAQFIMNKLSFKDFIKFGFTHNEGEGLKTPHKGQAFWDFRPFTRLLYWGKDYRNALSYLLKNTLEALGFMVYQPRKKIAAYQVKDQSWRLLLPSG